MHRSFLVGLAAASVIALSATEADACGGCINAAPTVADAGSTTQSGTVVTDHRMVLSLTGSSTTLWDQIEYAGDPQEFAWVLPIRGTVKVGLGSDAFIAALDQKTAPTIIGPRVLCNAAPPSTASGSSVGGDNGFGCGCASSDSASGAFAPMADAGVTAEIGVPDEGVTIKDRSVVGPYQTVQISGTDTESIVGWLRRNNFEIPENVEPILTKYVTEGFDFLAVRLRPGFGVHAMQPIRVTWPGSAPMLPLRMVAAGVAARVGIKLFVLGDGRWKTKNFATFTIGLPELEWNFETGRSNYSSLREAYAKAADDHAFALESSIEIGINELPYEDPYKQEPPPGDGGASDAAPAENDVDVAFGKKPYLRVTRLRADLPLRHLSTDLELEADDSQLLVPTTYRLTRQVGAEKLCAFGVASVTLATSSSALTGPVEQTGPSNTVASDCAIGDRPSRAALPMVFFAALGLCTLARKRRR